MGDPTAINRSCRTQGYLRPANTEVWKTLHYGKVIFHSFLAFIKYLTNVIIILLSRVTYRIYSGSFPSWQACQSKEVSTISERLIHKMSVQAPPKVMVEKYLVEIANNYNIEYEPDPQVFPLILYQVK